MRVQGGSSGIIAAFSAGRLDPLDANFEGEDDRDRPILSGSDWRELHRRRARRLKRLSRYARLHRDDVDIAELSPF